MILLKQLVAAESSQSLSSAGIVWRMWIPSLFSSASKSSSQEHWMMGFSLKGYMLLAILRSSLPGDSAMSDCVLRMVNIYLLKLPGV